MKISTLSTLIASFILMTLATGCLETTSAERVAMYEQAIRQANQTSAAWMTNLTTLRPSSRTRARPWQTQTSDYRPRGDSPTHWPLPR
ncbi:MAG: hypothetical protein HQ515_10180 [Phycisphaeraceae bacterium]|nr:hypothetical protein [Phycisphaeraceae bacterium]